MRFWRLHKALSFTCVSLVLVAACTVPDFVFPPSATDAGLVDAPAVDTGHDDEETPVDAGVDTRLVGLDNRCPTGVVTKVDGIDHCYYFTTTLVDCLAACPSGGHLVTILTSTENDQIVSQVLSAGPMVGVPPHPGDFWLGLRADAATNNKAAFSWVTGEDGSFRLWKPSRPNGSGPCAIARFDEASAGGWDDREYNQSHRALCEMELP